MLLPKFHIFRRSEISWGGQKSVTNNERTPQTIIRPRQDSQNPRANTVIALSRRQNDQEHTQDFQIRDSLTNLNCHALGQTSSLHTVSPYRITEKA